jgi:hypothetical protein
MASLRAEDLLDRDRQIRTWILRFPEAFATLSPRHRRTLVLKYGLGHTELGKDVEPLATGILNMTALQDALEVNYHTRAQQLLKDAILAFIWQIIKNQTAADGDPAFPTAVGQQLGCLI